MEGLVVLAVIGGLVLWASAHNRKLEAEQKRLAELERQRRAEKEARKQADARRRTRGRQLGERGLLNRDGLPPRWARPVGAARSAARDYDKAVQELSINPSDSHGLGSRLADASKLVHQLVERCGSAVLAARHLEKQVKKLEKTQPDTPLIPETQQRVDEARETVDEWVHQLRAAAAAASHALLSVHLALPPAEAATRIDDQALALRGALEELLPL